MAAHTVQPLQLQPDSSQLPRKDAQRHHTKISNKESIPNLCMVQKVRSMVDITSAACGREIQSGKFQILLQNQRKFSKCKATRQIICSTGIARERTEQDGHPFTL